MGKAKNREEMTRAILVIDMINEFISGRLKCERAKAIIPNIRRLIDFSRKKGVPVIYACDAHKVGDRELEIWGPHAMNGSKEAEVIAELKPEKEDYVVKKRTYNAFFQTELDSILRKLGVDELVLTGILADICVMNTAAEAFFRGYKILVPEDCVESLTKEEKDRALEYIKKVYGAKITSVREIETCST